jgi:hypothetical protein
MKGALPPDNAGGWRMIVMSAPDQIAVPAPATVTSDACKAKVAAVGAAQSAMTPAQRSNRGRTG